MKFGQSQFLRKFPCFFFFFQELDSPRVRGLGYMTVSEMLETMHENDLFNMFPEFSNAVHIFAVIPATLCSAERSFIAFSAQIETLPLQHHGATTCQ